MTSASRTKDISFSLLPLFLFLFYLLPTCQALLTGKPAAYLSVGTLGAIPIRDAPTTDIVVNQQGAVNIDTNLMNDLDIGGTIQDWIGPITLFSTAQRRKLQPLEAKAVVPEYSLQFSAKGSCSSYLTVKDADTGEVYITDRNQDLAFYDIPEGKNITFGFELRPTLGLAIGCGKVEWKLVTALKHYTFGNEISDESKQFHNTRRPPIAGRMSVWQN
ncbi:hypothetical protein LTR67_007648 [Exophiala xenobiotica]